MNFESRMACAASAVAVLISAGCALSRGPQATDEHVDDATITGQIRARIIDHPIVSWTRFSVETLDGTVMLSGFARTTAQKETAEQIAHDVNGVRNVNNLIEVRR
jgi:osmotically-inducible protein OsmY